MTEQVVTLLKQLASNPGGVLFKDKKDILEKAMALLGITGVKIVERYKNSICLEGEEKFFRLAERFLNIVSYWFAAGKAFETDILDKLREAALSLANQEASF